MGFNSGFKGLMGSHTTKIMFTYQILMQTSIQSIKEIQKSWRKHRQMEVTSGMYFNPCSSHTKMHRNYLYN